MNHEHDLSCNTGKKKTHYYITKQIMNCAFICIYLLFAYMPLSYSYNLLHVSSCQHASSNTYSPAEGDGMIPLAFSPLNGARALWNECVARTRRSDWYTILMSEMTG